MKKILQIATVAVIITIAAFFFTPMERHARYIRNNQHRVTVGMTTAEVKALLSEPDTVYMSYDYGPGLVHPVKVLEYYRGFASADNLRVLIVNDTVANFF